MQPFLLVNKMYYGNITTSNTLPGNLDSFPAEAILLILDSNSFWVYPPNNSICIFFIPFNHYPKTLLRL